VEPAHGGSHQRSVRQLGAVKCRPGVVGHELYQACSRCAWHARHAQREHPTQRGILTGCPRAAAVAALVRDFRSNRSGCSRCQRWSFAHPKEIRCDSKRESTLGWSTSIMKSPSYASGISASTASKSTTPRPGSAQSRWLAVSSW
jgi:hypothetical protein